MYLLVKYQKAFIGPSPFSKSPRNNKRVFGFLCLASVAFVYHWNPNPMISRAFPKLNFPPLKTKKYFFFTIQCPTLWGRETNTQLYNYQQCYFTGSICAEDNTPMMFAIAVPQVKWPKCNLLRTEKQFKHIERRTFTKCNLSPLWTNKTHLFATENVDPKLALTDHPPTKQPTNQPTTKLRQRYETTISFFAFADRFPASKLYN